MKIKSKAKRTAIPKFGDNEKYAEFRERLKIERDDLDTEVAQQPFLFMQIGEEYTMLVSQRDKMKEEVDNLYAFILMQVRSKKAEEKMTNADADARVSVDPSYQLKVREYHQLNGEVAKWGALREAFAQRGYMLRELCGLYASGYWSSTRVSGQTGDAGIRNMKESMRRKRLS